MLRTHPQPRTRDDMAKKQAKRAGRPKADPATHQTKPIPVRFTDQDEKRVKAAAKKRGLKPSQFLRQVAIEAAKKIEADEAKRNPSAE